LILVRTLGDIGVLTMQYYVQHYDQTAVFMEFAAFGIILSRFVYCSESRVSPYLEFGTT